jgi:putative integral membrane protein (TIGR02587 family)
MTSERYAIGLSRAFGGAIVFGIPLLMTMEMWSLGFSMDRGRLLLLMIFSLILLVGLSYFSGFEKTFSLKEDAMDAFAAFGVGVITSAALLVLLAVVTFEMTWSEIVGRVALQSVPASIGAMLGRKQFGAQDMDAEEERKKEAGYAGEIFLMLVGALLLAFNVAPTEEMILIAFQMTPWHALALGALSILLLHAFVYNIGFSGQESRPEGGTFLTTLLRFTLPGYGIALLVSLYVLWSFGRTTETALPEIANMLVVLGFPAALGAATARLVV